MTRYEITRNSLSDALSPVVAYCQRAHETLDATDPAQSGRWWHVNQLDALTTAIVDYGEEAEKAQEALKSVYLGSSRIQAFCARVHTSMAQIGRTTFPAPSPLTGQINSYCLPAPSIAPLSPDGQSL